MVRKHAKESSSSPASGNSLASRHGKGGTCVPWAAAASLQAAAISLTLELRGQVLSGLKPSAFLPLCPSAEADQAHPAN